MTGIIVGYLGSVFVAQNGGQNWVDSSVSLKENETVMDWTFSTDGNTGVIVGDEGSVFVTRNSGQSWDDFSNRLKEHEFFMYSSFSTDRKTGVIVSNQGSIFVAQNSGQSWIDSSVSLKENETVMDSKFSADVKRGAIVGDKGSVFFTRNGGQGWIDSNVNLKENEFFRILMFNAGGKTGVIVGDEGSVFVTRNGGQSWIDSSVNLKEDEYVTDTIFSADQIVGIIVGSTGSVNVTWNGGVGWGYTDLSEMQTGSRHLEDFTICKFREDSYAILASQDNENVFQLKKYKGFADWKNLSILQLEKKFQHADEPIRNSNLSQGVLGRIQKFRQIAGDLKKDVHTKNKENKDQFEKSIYSIDSLTVNRVVTFTLLFFLARVLFQFSRYHLRLASFWDSRSDAMLLAEDFAAEKSEKFDDLVYALGPDFHNFASMPKNTFENLRSAPK